MSSLRNNAKYSVLLVIAAFILSQNVVSAQQLIAYISQHGLHGEITFRQVNATTVEIKAKLETTLQYPEQVWSWGVRKFPVDYSDIDPESRCSLEKLGAQVLSFDESLDYLVLPGNETATWHREMMLIGERDLLTYLCICYCIAGFVFLHTYSAHAHASNTFNMIQ
ncbi:PREDICTED: uncharacterized protein LOC108370262 [Rhagoletis zephyria]|uniref:uncharacterized protein LOC108370262 n=1 Tax=Rhagoletis zephyria TaxID=28612 RepID=UPI00081181FB|nr:PREDICTED: uncharacterized protein LOC108370262 [Rhagoletis zephyria]